jgi:hypothetical protein
MMVSRPHVVDSNQEYQEYSDQEYSDSLGEEEEMEMEEYSDEEIDEFTMEIHHVPNNQENPRTFEDFEKLYRSQQQPANEILNAMEETKRKVTFDEPKNVEYEIEAEFEEQILTMPENKNDGVPSENLSKEEREFERYEEDLEQSDPEIEEMMDEEELEDEEEVEEEEEIISGI